jgi:hypothetical protein
METARGQTLAPSLLHTRPGGCELEMTMNETTNETENLTSVVL